MALASFMCTPVQAVADIQREVAPTSLGAALRTLRALFVTHLHSDHTVDYPNILKRE
jgi:ribonuclease BN (tRNA processing enzyme)